MGRILGIDLGTTNSCAAVMDSGRPLVIPTDADKYVLPSVVAFAEDGRLLVGREAKRHSVTDAANTIVAAKRLMGIAFNDPRAKQAIDAANYTCIEGPSGDVRVQVRGRTYALPEISALIVAELKRCAEAHLGERVDQAVITCPAYFNDFQRQATRDAGRIAGLDVIRILNEPTAAALAYGALSGGHKRRLVVYDLGGGTFDVSVLAAEAGTIEVLATAGDAFLGGRDFDQIIVDWLVPRIEREHGIKVTNNPNTMQRIWEAAEAAKIDLSEKAVVSITLPFLTEKDGAPVHVGESMERAEFEKRARPLVERTLQVFVDTLKTAGLTPRDVDEVILVGGMTRMPLVSQRVFELTGKAPSSGVHPDLVVAVGAAIQGDLLRNSKSAAKLVDVTPHNLGIRTVAGLAETIIPKDKAIPTEAHRTFTTAHDNQESVRIVVFQGDSRRIEQNQILGEFVLGGIRPAPRGNVQIDVAFQITSDGIVNVAAKDLETGRAQSIEIRQSHTLAAHELDRMAAAHQALVQAAWGSGASTMPQPQLTAAAPSSPVMSATLPAFTGADPAPLPHAVPAALAAAGMPATPNAAIAGMPAATTAAMPAATTAAMPAAATAAMPAATTAAMPAATTAAMPAAAMAVMPAAAGASSGASPFAAAALSPTGTPTAPAFAAPQVPPLPGPAPRPPPAYTAAPASPAWPRPAAFPDASATGPAIIQPVFTFAAPTPAAIAAATPEPVLEIPMSDGPTFLGPVPAAPTAPMTAPLPPPTGAAANEGDGPTVVTQLPPELARALAGFSESPSTASLDAQAAPSEASKPEGSAPSSAESQTQDTVIPVPRP